MPEETMTPRERWLAVLEGRTPDRVPLDYWATSEASRKLVDYMGARDLATVLETLHVDRPVTVGPTYTGPAPKAGEDIFGCRHRQVQYPTGVYSECVYHPLAEYETVAEIEREYQWPSIDWWDFSGIPRQVEGHEDQPIRGGGSEPFLQYVNLRGMERAYMDLIDKPEIVHYCLDRLFDLRYDLTLRIYEAIPGRVLISYVAEDMGSQEGLLFSPAQIREFLLPRMKRMMDLVHSAGAYVFHHSDGAIRQILPDMIDAGIDVLNPIQWRCAGMDRERLKADFGSRIAFHGAMDNQYTLPFGSVDEVRREVADNIDLLGHGGGYILAPCHNIQAVGPPENIVAMYQTAYEQGWY
jgi:uroporphyrinogen decarboxylase